MNGQEIKLPENLQSSEKAGFIVMKSFILDVFGDAYLDKVARKCREEFAKGGVLGWNPNDANTVVDVSPMPPPWVGQWGFRIRFAAIQSDGNALVNQFYVPQSTIPMFRKGDMSAIE